MPKWDTQLMVMLVVREKGLAVACGQFRVCRLDSPCSFHHDGDPRCVGEIFLIRAKESNWT